MNKIVFFATFLCTSALFGQLSPIKVQYTFKVVEISDEAAAKNIADELRSYFDVLPAFDEDEDQFVVSSNVLITEEQLQERLLAKGFHLELFARKEDREGLNNKQ